MKFLFYILPVLLTFNSYAVEIGGTINQYSKITSGGNCKNTIIVSNPEYFSVDEEVIVIQMQGAVISTIEDVTYGNVTDLNNTGNFERAKILAILNDTIYFNNDLVNTYDFNAPLQIVSFPHYQNVTISSTLTCKSWDGKTGGVMAFLAFGTTTFDAPIDVSGKGFRGGNNLEIAGNGCSWLVGSNGYSYPNSSWEGSSKGEGISIIQYGKEFGMGAQANGGGGGNDHNTGGAGGGNYASGGRGGDNDDPSTFACKGYSPGIGGKGLGYSSNVAFMGGGGGAGHGNNGLSSAGANGGGIVLIMGNNLAGAQQNILSKGNDAARTGGGDGAGAGGAGGTVLLSLLDLGTDLNIDVSGGVGGNVDDEFYNRCHGPGGGGAGGIIRSTRDLSNVTMTLDGGEAGIIINSTAACNETPGGATNGSPGISQDNLVLQIGVTDIECLITSSKKLQKQLAYVFPNPAKKNFSIQHLTDFIKVEVLDNSGKLIQTLNRNEQYFGQNYAAGIYFVRVISKESIQTLRVIKAK